MRVLILVLICLSMTGCSTFLGAMQGLGNGMSQGAQQTYKTGLCSTQKLGGGMYNTYCN